MHKGHVTDITPDGVNGPVNVTQNVEKYQQIDDASGGNGQCLLPILVHKLNKRVAVQFHEKVVEVKDIQRQMDAHRQREEHHGGKGHLLDEVVEPSGAKKQRLAVGAAHVGDAVTHSRYTLVQPTLFVAV